MSDTSLQALLRTTRQDPTLANITKLVFAAKRENQTVYLREQNFLIRLEPAKKRISVHIGQIGQIEGMPRSGSRWWTYYSGLNTFYNPKKSKGATAFTIYLRETVDLWGPQEAGGEPLDSPNIIGHEGSMPWTPVRTNPDEQDRKRSRQAKQTGSVADQAAAIVDKMRSGELDPDLVEWAASLGSPVARAVFPNIQHRQISDYLDITQIVDVRRAIFSLKRSQHTKLVRFAWKLTGDSQRYGEWNNLRGDGNRVAYLMDYLWDRSASVNNREIFHAISARIGDFLIGLK